ncbi:hypothetical protein SprV_0602139100 [Sparganum proliferum]
MWTLTVAFGLQSRALAGVHVAGSKPQSKHLRPTAVTTQKASFVRVLEALTQMRVYHSLKVTSLCCEQQSNKATTLSAPRRQAGRPRDLPAAAQHNNQADL